MIGGIVVYRVFFYHQWQYEKAERYLQKMEADGYRLQNIRFSFLFCFKKAVPKKTKYVFLYHYMKDYNSDHYTAQNYLCHCCNAVEICGKRHFEPEVYRTTMTQANIDEILRFRDRYLKRAFRIKIMTALLFLLPILLLTVLGAFPDSNANAIILVIIAAVAALVIGYYTIGLIALCRKCFYRKR